MESCKWLDENSHFFKGPGHRPAIINIARVSMLRQYPYKKQKRRPDPKCYFRLVCTAEPKLFICFSYVFQKITLGWAFPLFCQCWSSNIQFKDIFKGNRCTIFFSPLYLIPTSQVTQVGLALSYPNPHVHLLTGREGKSKTALVKKTMKALWSDLCVFIIQSKKFLQLKNIFKKMYPMLLQKNC